MRVDVESGGGSCPREVEVRLAGIDVSGEGMLGEDEVMARLAVCRCGGTPGWRAGGAWASSASACATSIWLRADSDGDGAYTAIAVARSLLVALAPSPARPTAVVREPSRPAERTEARALESICSLRYADRSTTDSSECLGCHDGTIADSVGFSTPIRRTESHPVGVAYDDAQARGRARLRPRADLAAALVLVDGKVECTTCHSGTSSEPARAALPRRRSALCLACHDF